MSTSIARRPDRSPARRRLPRAPGLPLLGSSLAAYRDPCRVFFHAHQACGPAFEVRYPGRRLTMLAGPAANELLAGQSRLFSSSRTYARVTRELGTATYPNAHDGAAHRELRQLCAPSFTASAVAPFLPRVYERVTEAVVQWPTGRPIQLAAALSTAVADAVSLCTMGRRLGAALARDATVYGTMMGVVGVGGAFPDFTLFSPPVQRARRRLAAFARGVLDDHRERPPTLRRDPDLIDALLAAGGQRQMDLGDRALEALSMLPFKNAGIYLYRFISFALWELWSRPDVLDAVRSEVDGAFRWGAPSVEMLRGMAALQGLLHEALRMYPMAIALPRVVAAPFEFAGHGFEEGETIYFATPVTHFLPECFDEPDRFDIGRYGSGRAEHHRTNIWVPFGVGPHACVAKAFSMTLAAAVVAAVVHGADVEIVDPTPRAPVRGLPIPIPEARFRIRRLAVRDRPAARGSGAETMAVLGSPIPLPPELRDRVQAALTDRSAAPGTVLYRPGDPPDAFWVIRSGVVELFAEQDGGERRVARLGKNAHFGDPGLLQGVARTTGARVLGKAPAALVRLDADAYIRLVVEADQTAVEIVRLLQRRRAVGNLAKALPNLKVERLRRLGATSRTVEARPGEVLFRQGDRADAFYVLIEGSVDILLEGGRRPEVVVAHLDAPECFGEIGLLNRTPRTATARVSTAGPARLLAFDEAAFSALVADSSGTGADLVRAAGERLAELSRVDDE